eukprot:2698682-Amphidinium_carterae.2
MGQGHHGLERAKYFLRPILACSFESSCFGHGVEYSVLCANKYPRQKIKSLPCCQVAGDALPGTSADIRTLCMCL